MVMNTSPYASQVAATIQAQVGSLALRMIGASQFMYGTIKEGDFLVFKISGCRKGNKLRIILNASDEYTFELWKVSRTLAAVKVAEDDMIQFDGLRASITRLTGLHTSF